MAEVVSTGEAVLFWVLAPFTVLGALALLFAKRPVHIAVSIAGVLVSLAVFYVALEAPFLGAVQVVVYTGAVMMLFLFVIMLIGVDSRESLTETLAGQRWIAVIGGVGLLALVIVIVTRANFSPPLGLAEANAQTNPVGVAKLIFGDYVLPFELTAALLITAALGALVLSHKQRLSPRVDQRETVARKLARFKNTGSISGIISRPGPGVYARSNSADTPAMSATGETIDASVSTVLRVRGDVIGDSEVNANTGRVALIATGEPVVETAEIEQVNAGQWEDTLPDAPEQRSDDHEGDQR